MTHTGGCHCGKVRFEVETNLEQVIECNCSHCEAKGLLLSFVPAEKFRFLAGEGEMSEYRFNKHLIAHRFCPTCGVQPMGMGVSTEGAATVAVNVRCLDTVDIGTLERTPVDGKSF